VLEGDTALDDGVELVEASYRSKGFWRTSSSAAISRASALAAASKHRAQNSTLRWDTRRDVGERKLSLLATLQREQMVSKHTWQLLGRRADLLQTTQSWL